MNDTKISVMACSKLPIKASLTENKESKFYAEAFSRTKKVVEPKYHYQYMLIHYYCQKLIDMMYSFYPDVTPADLIDYASEKFEKVFVSGTTEDRPATDSSEEYTPSVLEGGEASTSAIPERLAQPPMIAGGGSSFDTMSTPARLPSSRSTSVERSGRGTPAPTTPSSGRQGRPASDPPTRSRSGGSEIGEITVFQTRASDLSKKISLFISKQERSLEPHFLRIKSAVTREVELSSDITPKFNHFLDNYLKEISKMFGNHYDYFVNNARIGVNTAEYRDKYDTVSNFYRVIEILQEIFGYIVLSEQYLSSGGILSSHKRAIESLIENHYRATLPGRYANSTDVFLLGYLEAQLYVRTVRGRIRELKEILPETPEDKDKPSEMQLYIEELRLAIFLRLEKYFKSKLTRKTITIPSEDLGINFSSSVLTDIQKIVFSGNMAIESSRHRYDTFYSTGSNEAQLSKISKTRALGETYSFLTRYLYYSTTSQPDSSSEEKRAVLHLKQVETQKEEYSRKYYEAFLRLLTTETLETLCQAEIQASLDDEVHRQKYVDSLKLIKRSVTSYAEEYAYHRILSMIQNKSYEKDRFTFDDNEEKIRRKGLGSLFERFLLEFNKTDMRKLEYFLINGELDMFPEEKILDSFFRLFDPQRYSYRHFFDDQIIKYRSMMVGISDPYYIRDHLDELNIILKLYGMMEFREKFKDFKIETSKKYVLVNFPLLFENTELKESVIKGVKEYLEKNPNPKISKSTFDDVRKKVDMIKETKDFSRSLLYAVAYIYYKYVHSIDDPKIIIFDSSKSELKDGQTHVFSFDSPLFIASTTGISDSRVDYDFKYKGYISFLKMTHPRCTIEP